MRSLRTTLVLGATLFILPGSAFANSTSKGISQALVPGAASQLYSKFLPAVEDIALPQEQAIVADLVSAISNSGADPATMLASADAALAKLPAPTRLRGYVQFHRASILSPANRDLDALAALQESVRLLPGYSGPLLATASTLAYLDRPSEAADYLLRAIAIDPQTVRTFDDYEVDNLLTRLRYKKDERRVEELSDRLVEIGWIGTRVGSGSQLAYLAIKKRVKRGEIASARALVPQLLIPGQSYSLLESNSYREIWPDIETWAGLHLERQWTSYLAEARARSISRENREATLDYLNALIAARRYVTATEEILPRFQNMSREGDYDLVFGIYSMAKALARTKRWKDADALFDHARTVWSIDSDANALNVWGNQAQFMLLEGRSKEALEQIDRVLAKARQWGPQVGSGALSAMHETRSCILAELGRNAEARVAMAAASANSSPMTAVSLHICLDDLPSAKRNLLIALRNEDFRNGALSRLQKPSEGPLDSPYAIKIRAREDALRSDPEILQEAAKLGRIMPWPIDFGANMAK